MLFKSRHPTILINVGGIRFKVMVSTIEKHHMRFWQMRLLSSILLNKKKSSLNVMESISDMF